MKRSQLYDILNAYEGLMGQPERTVRFSTMAIRNRRVAMEALKDLEMGLNSDEKWAEYTRKRVALLEQLSKKDEKGAPVLIDGEVDGKPCKKYDLDEINQKIFDEEWAKLKEQYKDTLIGRDKALKEFDSMMSEECPEELMSLFIKVPEESVPNIPVEALAPWEPFIVYKT